MDNTFTLAGIQHYRRQIFPLTKHCLSFFLRQGLPFTLFSVSVPQLSYLSNLSKAYTDAVSSSFYTTTYLDLIIPWITSAYVPWVVPYINGRNSFLSQILYWKIWHVHAERDEGLSFCFWKRYAHTFVCTHVSVFKHTFTLIQATDLK